MQLLDLDSAKHLLERRVRHLIIKHQLKECLLEEWCKATTRAVWSVLAFLMLVLYKKHSL